MTYFFYRFAGILLLFLLQCQLYAQVFPAPEGVYCSCGPTTGNGSGSVAPNIAAKPFVKGILVRVGWELAEPSENNYNWNLIDGQIAAAKSYGKKVSLGVGCGIAIPQWVFDAGAERLVSSMPFNDTIAIPWDAVFLEKWTHFIGQLGNRYQNDTMISLVYMTASTGNGYEMQLPFVTSPTLSAAGYSDNKMIDSWKAIIDAFNTALPNHFLSNDFHPVNGSNVVADSVYAYASAAIGYRYGASAWWWTQKNTTTYPAQYDILQHSAANNQFTGIQMARNGTVDSAAFGPGGMPGALELAINNKVCYWEVWNQDILNPAFESLLINANCAVSAVSETQKPEEHEFRIYPNPGNGQFFITAKSDFQLTIFNAFGGLEYSAASMTSPISPIDLSGLPPGIYFAVAQMGNQELHTQKLVIVR